MNRLIFSIFCLFVSLSSFSQRQQLFNSNWTFSLEGNSEMQNKQVTLPHDWSILFPTDKSSPMGGEGGYYVAGKGVYTKKFIPEKEWQGKKNSLLFEGVYMNATIVLNGKEIASHGYGWTPFEVDITNAVEYDVENTLVVLVDNSKQKNCRWYTGSGIYRNVWLKSVPMNDAIGDFAVHAMKQGDDYSLAVDCKTKLTAIVKDKVGNTIAEGELPLTVKNPKEWSPEEPVLYNLVLKSSTDEVQTRIGFRTIEYSAEKGMMLNGKKVIMNGACVHSDNGPLGACAYKGAETRRVESLKKAGFNAVRTSHNPPSEAFLDACDSIGLLVIDEIFDGWRTQKNTYDYSTLFDNYWQQDVDAWVKRDVNHPSIWCWSIGNEVIERTEPECVMTARKLAGRVHSLDPYRPVTSAMCSWSQGWARFDTLMAQHDICGYNYYMHEAENDHKRVPERVIMQTESFPRDAVKNWQAVMKNDYVIGDFVWTGIDYLGESGLGRFHYEGQTAGESWQADQYPWHGAYCGDIDLLGWRKPISYLRDMLYNKDRKGLHIAVLEPDGYYGKINVTMWSVWPAWERWTWKGWEGKPIKVEVYSNAESVKMYLNNKLIDEQPVVNSTATFTVNYKPGILKAEGIVGGKVAYSESYKTAGKANKVVLKQENYEGLTYVTATVVDKNGTPIPDPYELTFSSNTEILATASADLTDTVSYTSHTRKTWNGMAQAIVRSADNLQVKVTYRPVK